MKVNDINNLVSTKPKTLKEYLSLSNNVYKIPYSQRKFEWGKNQIQRLFYDAYRLYQADDGDVHMLNVITVLSNDDDLLIYDGQQRTITCLLLIAAVAKESLNIKSELSDELIKNYIHYQSAIDDNENRKISFDSDIDTAFFYKMIDPQTDIEDLNKQKAKEDKNSNKRAFIDGYITMFETLDQYQWNKDSITKFIRIFLEKFFLVEMRVTKQEIAEKMYETLNNTGKDLEKYFVLKNDIIRQLGDDQVREKWNIIDGNLGNIPYNKFLRCFAQVIYGKTSASKTLDNIYKKYNRDNEEEMRRLLKDLYNSSNDFLKVIYPNDLNGTSRDIMEYRELSHYFKTFSFIQHYAIILAMFIKDYSFKDINSVLKAILVVYIRNFYFRLEKTNIVENAFANFAKMIYYDEISIDDLLSDIYSLAKKDFLVENSILEKKNSKASAVKSLLTIIYNKDSKEQKVSPENVDLEHILPQKPKKDSIWRNNFSDDDMKDYVNKLGNLTLWYAEDNRSARNDEFSKKVESYKTSQLKENITISEKDNWTKKEIDQRTKDMAEQILKIFKINN